MVQCYFDIFFLRVFIQCLKRYTFSWTASQLLMYHLGLKAAYLCLLSLPLTPLHRLQFLVWVPATGNLLSNLQESNYFPETPDHPHHAYLFLLVLSRHLWPCIPSLGLTLQGLVAHQPAVHHFPPRGQRVDFWHLQRKHWREWELVLGMTWTKPSALD